MKEDRVMLGSHSLSVLAQEDQELLRLHLLLLSIHQDLVRSPGGLVARGGLLQDYLGVLVEQGDVLHVVLVLGEDSVAVLGAVRGHEMVAVIQVIAGGGCGGMLGRFREGGRDQGSRPVSHPVESLDLSLEDGAL